MREEDVAAPKKPYEAPHIIHSEKLEGRSTNCVQSDFTCNPGPIQS